MRLPSMLRVTGSGLVVLLVLLFADRPAAHATSLTYDFEVTATSGPLTGISSSGNFSFDDSIIPVGGGIVGATGLLTDLEFAWNGTNYNEFSANTGFLVFDASGTFSAGCFGNNAFAGGCAVSEGSEQWLVLLDANATSLFSYAATGTTTIGEGTATFSQAQSVPEPSSLLLLGSGLVGLGGLVAWRRKHAA